MRNLEFPCHDKKAQRKEDYFIDIVNKTDDVGIVLYFSVQ